MEIGNREISFKGLLKSMALINMLDHVDETPKYIFVSQLGEESQNMADISYKWIDPTSKKMFKGGIYFDFSNFIRIDRLRFFLFFFLNFILI